MKQFNIIICGVGGTGVIGMGETLRKAAMSEGNRVLGAESRGSGQRGGPATASVRFTASNGKEAHNERSTLWTGSVGVGSADLMIATEIAEALRNAHYLCQDSKVLLNNFKYIPKQTRKEKKAGTMTYPSNDEVVAKLKQLTPHVRLVNASDLSMEHFGSYLMTNPIMMGMSLARGMLPLKKESVKRLMKGATQEALELGFRSV